MVRALGAEPVELAYGQVLAGLSTRVIEVLVMSRRAWESLSDDDRSIFREAARASSRYMRQLWSGLEEHSRQQARAAGNIIIEVDRKPFAEAMDPVYAKAASGARDQQELIERIRQTQ